MARSPRAVGGRGSNIPTAPRSYPPLGRYRKPEKEEEKPTLKKKFLSEGRNFLFDFMAAVIVLLIIIGSLFTYTGNWPPLVVVQSGSMEHSDESSSVGVIDTGDLVFVKKMGDDPIIPYVEGLEKHHRTYSSYGDVIIFRPNGDTERTAIIHRAIVYIEFNESDYDAGNFTGGSYDIPSMGLYHQTGTIYIEDFEWPYKNDIPVALGTILNFFASDTKHPHSGYITKGDANDGIDQTSPFPNQPWLEPIQKDWVIGKSVGELPWFGIIKLKMEGKEDWHPNSQKSLLIALLIIVVSPFIIDFSIHMIARGIKKDEDEEEEEPAREKARPNDEVKKRGPPMRPPLKR